MKRLTYEYVKDYVEKCNYTLLSNEYKNNKTKILLKCNECGKEFYMKFNSFKDSNHRCECQSKPIKLTYDYVKNFVESFGYELLSDVYVNNSTKILLQCDKKT